MCNFSFLLYIYIYINTHAHTYVYVSHDPREHGLTIASSKAAEVSQLIWLPVTSDMGDRGDIPSLDLSRLKVISALGRGAKGVVFLVQTDHSSHQEFLALKAISRASIEKDRISSDGSDDEYRRISFEQEVLRRLHHPLLPSLRGTVATDKIVGYAIDYCPGRDLASLRKKQTEKMFSDDTIRFYAAELVLALEHLHGLGIVYRDLKPENVLIQENGHLMLVDFDLSTQLPAKSPQTHTVVKPVAKPTDHEPILTKKKRRFVSYRCCNAGISPEDSVSPPKLLLHHHHVSASNSESESVEKSNSFVGTEEYVAPEIISGNGHDFAVDWWCLGIVLYEMLYGETPFRGSNRKETFYRILTKPAGLVGEATPLRDLIGRLLEKDPKRRISVEGIKGHDFFRGVDWDLILHVPRPPYIPHSGRPQDIDGNKGIDVEAIVQEVFKTGNNQNKTETRSYNDSEGAKKNPDTSINHGVWVEGLNHPPLTDNFFVF